MQDLTLTLPIPQNARSHAQRFAVQQPTPEKAEQVRLNTIAVCVVNNYLQMLDIKTSLALSDSWNPIMQLCSNVADLEITGIGRLECRPIKAFQPTCPIPPEVWESRIGYVVVEIDDTFRQAKILGFTPIAVQESLPIRQLQPIEEMIDHLHQLKNPSPNPINLSQWFDDLFETGWESLETLLKSVRPQPAFNFRGSAVAEPREAINWQKTLEMRRGRLIDLRNAGHSQAPPFQGGVPSDFDDQTLMLVINLKAISEQRIEIGLQVHPTEAQIYLPLGLKLTVFDESDNLFMEAQARRADNAIQLFFTGEISERFKIQITLEQISLTEHFVI